MSGWQARVATQHGTTVRAYEAMSIFTGFYVSCAGPHGRCRSSALSTTPRKASRIFRTADVHRLRSEPTPLREGSELLPVKKLKRAVASHSLAILVGLWPESKNRRPDLPVSLVAHPATNPRSTLYTCLAVAAVASLVDFKVNILS